MIKRYFFKLPLPALLHLVFFLISSSLPAQLTFTRADYQAGRYPGNVSIADFNGDGHLDLAVSNNHWNEEAVQGVAILFNDGSGIFGAPVIYQTGESADDLHTGDLDGDGHPDIVVASRLDDQITVLLNDGQGVFTNAGQYQAEGTLGVQIADFNNDGKPDIAAISDPFRGIPGVAVFINGGDGAFADAVLYPVEAARQLGVGDINNDGYPDIAVTGGAEYIVSVLLNNGDGTFALPVTHPTGQYPLAVIIHDLDGDGWRELAVTNRNDNSISVFVNNGDGTFAAQSVYQVRTDPDYPGGSSAAMLAAGDLDGDGYPELAVADYGSPAGASVLLNNGDGTFSLAPVLSASGDYNIQGIGVAMADLDKDGRNDVVVSNGWTNGVSVFLNNVELPVTLSAFEASAQEPSVLLTWSTSEEVNFSHFEIQRSADGRQWQPVGEVTAAGLRDATRTYRYSDGLPLPGLSYYRLKMIDLDGTYAYSEIRSVISNAPPVSPLDVYPNPASDRIMLTTSGTVSEVLLRNLSGRLLRKVSHYEKDRGIPVAGLGPGVVLLEVRYADGTMTVEKVVVVQ